MLISIKTIKNINSSEILITNPSYFYVNMIKRQILLSGIFD